MIDLPAYQKTIVVNKLNKGFNTTDMCKEFCLTFGELSEAYDAYNKNTGTLGEKLADVAIYLLGLAELQGIDLEKEIKKKVAINDARTYD